MPPTLKVFPASGPTDAPHVHRALRGRMAERPAFAVASARKPRWTEPLTVTVGVHSLCDLCRVSGLSGRGAVGVAGSVGGVALGRCQTARGSAAAGGRADSDRHALRGCASADRHWLRYFRTRAGRSRSSRKIGLRSLPRAVTARQRPAPATASP